MRFGKLEMIMNLEQNKTGKGLRFNEGKIRYDLVDPWAHKQMVSVLTMGAIKYGERNWQLGMKWSTIIASLKRHLAAIEAGEDFDEESGELHAAHLACNAHFLSAYYKIFPQGDDRDHSYLHTPKIGLDVDEVLADWLGAWSDKFDLDVPDSWFFDRKISDRFASLRESGELDRMYRDLKPLVSPKDLPFEPHVYVTSRPVSTEVTTEWLDRNGFPARSVITVGVHGSKVAALKEAGVDMYIDDRFENFVELTNAGICTFLLDRPHNHRYDVGFKRVYNFQDFKNRFL